MGATSATASCTIIVFPTMVRRGPQIQTERDKPRGVVYWSDHPELVLKRLRELHGPKWWL